MTNNQWRITRVYLSRSADDKGRDELDKILAEGYEPFSTSPHIFMGNTLGDTIYLRRKREPLA